MRNTHSFKMNLPEMSDPVDVNELNDNFLVIDDALMAGLCKKELTTNNMGSSDPASRKYGWAPWLEIYNGNEFDVVVIDRNAPDLPSGTINIEAGETYRMYINGTYYMNFYVQDQHDVTFRWFTNAETRINEIEPSGGGGVSSVNVTGASGSHLETSGGPVTDSGTIEINLSSGYSIPSDEKQTEWDGKQDAISDLSTIRSGAASGATAVQPTALETALASKQDTISDLATIRSGASAGATAVQPATMSTALAAKQDVISDLSTIRSGSSAGATAVQPDALATVEDQAMYAVTRTGKNCAVFPETHTVGSITFTCDIVTGYITSSASNDPRAWNLANRNISWSLPAGTYIVYAEAPDTNSDRVEGYVFNGDTIVESIAVAVGGTNTVEITLTTSGSIGLEIKPRTDKVRYMICPKSVFDADPTYQPPSLTNVTMTPALIEQVDGGAKNIFPIQSLVPYGPGLSNNPNLTCTNNNDGTYTLNGSTVAAGTIHLCDWIEDTTYGGYVMSGCPKVNSSTEEKVRLALYTAAGSSGVAFDLGDGKQIPKTFDRSYLALYVFANKSFNNAVFKPMFCTLADWNVSQKFVPFAKSNKELTDLTSGLLATAYQPVTPVGNYLSGIEGGYVRVGNLVLINIRCTVSDATPASWTTLLSGLPYTLIQYGQGVSGAPLSNNKGADMAITSVGTITSSTALSTGTLLISGVYICK